MSDEQQDGVEDDAPSLADHIGKKATRKIRARKAGPASVWFGLGMMGLIGWSVTVPTVLGAALGIWLDERNPGGRSWTLALLSLGLVIGCVNAWHWVSREDKEMHKDDDE